MARPKAVLLPCGLHFGPPDESCQMCAEAERAKSQAIAAAQAPAPPQVSGPDPTNATATTAAVAVRAIGGTEPVGGVYDIPDSIYHRDPLKAYGTESLSGSSARHLLPPSTPAHYRWRMDHPSDSRTPAMIFGSAVHAATLDTAELVVFDGKSWNSKAGEQFLAEHDPDGDEAPVLAGDVAAVKAMAYNLRHHPIVAKAITGGRAEQAMFAQDPETGVWLRGKVDYLAMVGNGHLVIPDLKNTADLAHEAEFSRTTAKYGYHIQDAHYELIAHILDLAKTVSMIFATIESRPPYLINVTEVSSDDMRRAREVHRIAVRRFAECMASGEWPGYPSNTIQKLHLPVYAVRAEEDMLIESETP